MFQFTSRTLARRFLLALTLGLTMTCATAGGLVWYLTRCDTLSYLNRASASPRDPNERYLFACSYVWHSTDGGIAWNRIDPRGLPFGARDGLIAVDRKPGFLYLGLLINTSSSVHCWNCAWKNLRPAIFVSADDGHTWNFTYKFKRGPAGDLTFLALMVDPEKEGNAWAVIRSEGEITYYGSGTAGKFWKPACREFYYSGSGGCELPDDLLRPPTGNSTNGK
ncbi:MAG: hypothetical protein HYZ49_15905 [Chloroflexi bacterium]|nr:hypothetical protein [Chloroflexota bacterium]